MTRRLVLASLAVGVALAGADDPKAPLAESSTQIHQLQKQQADTRAGGEDNSLRSALPALNPALQGHEALPSTDPSSSEKDGKHKQLKKDASKTWLLDAYDKLEPKASRDKDATVAPLGAPAASAEERDGQEANENKDPATKIDIFALYESDAKKDAIKTSGNVRAVADPLAPFLQSWMSKTPTHDPLQLTSAKNDFDAVPAGAGVTVPVGQGIDPLPAAPDVSPTSAPAGENPYLATLNLLPLPSSASSPLPILPSALPDFAAPPAPGKALLGVPDPAPSAAKSDAYKPPPSQADEDRKYFPQLKRF